MERIVLDSPARIEQLQVIMWSWILPMEVQWRPHQPQRTLAQNNLYWQWMTLMGVDFTRRSLSQYKRGLILEPTSYEKKEMHDLSRHKFLGYQDYFIGDTRIEHQLRSSTDLSKKEMGAYMQCIDHWSAEHGLYLPRPEHSDYQRYLDGEYQ